MNKTCTKCGYRGENVWRDGKYYCAICESEIDVTQQDFQTNGTTSETPINATCPICRNATNNTLRSGKCHCALCGTDFDLTQQAYRPEPNATVIGANTRYSSAKRAELESEKNRRLMWGIVFLFFFWPVSIYHFYKMYQVSQEISKL